MFANRYTAFVDACSLVSLWRRNLLLSLAEAEFFRVRWSGRVLDETEAALRKLHVEWGHVDGAERAAKSIANIRRAFPEAEVQNYTILLATKYDLPDSNDEHVLAAAIRTQAQAIVTENLKDFPTEALEPLGLEARSADDFIADTIALDEGKAIATVRQMRQRLKRPAIEPDEMLRSFEAHGLVETASILAPHIASL